MIQRIQTLYLLCSLLLLGLMTWLNLGEIVVADALYKFRLSGIIAQTDGSVVYSGLPLIVMASVVALLQFFIIFGYKNRVRQMRLATINLMLMLGLTGVAWFFASKGVDRLGEGIIQYKIPLAFPVVGAILNYLAIRAIGRDEALVRSVDRIR